MITYRQKVVPVFTIPPNWKKPVGLMEMWDDQIAETLDTGEERIGTRPRARLGIRYITMTLTAQETGFIRKVLENDEALPIGCGLWQDARKVTAPSIAGNTFANCDGTTGTLFDVAPYTLAWKSFREFSTVRTLDVFTLGLNFSDALDIDLEVGDFVVPMVIGKISRDNMVALTDEHATFEVKFEEFSFVDAPLLCSAIDGDDLEVTLSFESMCVGGTTL